MSRASRTEPDEAQGEEWLRRALGLADGQKPFPWQLELLRSFLRGDAVQALDIPTGLGKTATMAIWLVARALAAALPRRLVYVDRRAVVDQATEVAEELREWVRNERTIAEALGLGDRPLPISTLRGQHVDNREWLEDPSAPAIVVGTVDMIGSRLLFSGYGVSSKMRPYHAGLIGADTLVVLDEALLVPPFEDLLREIANDSNLYGPTDPSLKALIPKLSLLSLSATGPQMGANAPHVLERRSPVGAELNHLRTLDDALDGFRELLAGAAGRLRLFPTAIDGSNDMLFGRSREWASVTPYVVTRHVKGLSASEALAIDVRSECRHVGLPEPRIESREVRGVAGLGLVGNVRLSFQVAVVGPIMLGRNRYFGGGLFQHSQP